MKQYKAPVVVATTKPSEGKKYLCASYVIDNGTVDSLRMLLCRLFLRKEK